jgi:hypothetical protein
MTETNNRGFAGERESVWNSMIWRTSTISWVWKSGEGVNVGKSSGAAAVPRAGSRFRVGG